MTKEELIKKIGAEISKLSDNASQMCEEYEGYHLACQDISDVLHEITKEIQPSLPSGLDEAAEEYACQFYPSFKTIKYKAFKAGAKWREQQIPKLPNNLDEASINYAYDGEPEKYGIEFAESNGRNTRNDKANAFKAGAEWMAGQGYTTEKTVNRTPLNGPAGICLNLHDSTGFKIGDKVIVQVRKKR